MSSYSSKTVTLASRLTAYPADMPSSSKDYSITTTREAFLLVESELQQRKNTNVLLAGALSTKVDCGGINIREYWEVLDLKNLDIQQVVDRPEEEVKRLVKSDFKVVVWAQLETTFLAAEALEKANERMNEWLVKVDTEDIREAYALAE